MLVFFVRSKDNKLLKFGTGLSDSVSMLLFFESIGCGSPNSSRGMKAPGYMSEDEYVHNT